MAALLLGGSDKLCYGGLKSKLTQQMSMGMNQNPHAVDETTIEDQHFKSNARAPEHHSEVVFAQSNATKTGEH